MKTPLTSGARLMSVADERAVITSVSEGEKITVNGFVGCVGFVKTADEVSCFEFTYPFTAELEREKTTKIYGVKADIESLTLRLVSLEKTEAVMTVAFSVFSEEEKTYKVIEEITETGVREEKTSAISVYMARKGEELFDTAKRLNVSPDDLIKTNEDLSFPLKSDERIIIFRQDE